MEIIDLIKALGALKTSVSLLKALGDLWTKVATEEDFDKALSNTLIRVNDHYDSEIFGGDVQYVLNQPEVKDHLKEILFAYGEIDQEVLSDYIDLDTLPKNYFEVFMSIYFEELIKYKELRKSVAEWQKSQDIVTIKDEVGRVQEELQTIKNTLGILLHQNDVLEEIRPIQYPSVTGYLPRSVVSFRDYTSTNLSDDYSRRLLLDAGSLTLFDSLNNKRKIVLLGVGGFGKSVELEHLAYQISKDQSSYPFLLKLGNYASESIDDLLREECDVWDQIPEERISIIFDGLDEIHKDEIDLFIRKLNRFSKLHPEKRIVASCRNNQYVLDDSGFGPLDGFAVYTLAPLKYEEIQSYLSKQLEENYQEFFDRIWERNLYDLIQSPFYLIKITQLYRDNGFLPKKRADLFEHLTSEKIKSDYNKFKLSGTDLRTYNKRIKKEINRIAFACQCLDKGVLDEFEELQEIVEDEEMLKRIQLSFLFNRGDHNKWEFEHNNFREYFTALYVKQKGFNFIKELMAFPPSFSKIKPQWVNTVTFLISILEKGSKLSDDVLAWLVEIEPDLLFRMEKEKLDISIRLKITKDIIEKYESRKLWLRSEKFSLVDIASFISGNDEAFDWMLARLSSDDDRVLSHTIEIMDGLRGNENQNPQLIESLDKVLKKDGLDEYTYYKLVKLMVKLEVRDESIIKVLRSKPDYEDNQYIRAAVYYFILSNNLADKYINLLIDGIAMLKELGVLRNARVKERKVYTQTETENLEKAISMICEKASLAQLMKWAIESLKSTPKRKAESILEVTAEKCKNFNLRDEDLFNPFVDFLIAVDRSYQPVIEKKLLEVVENTGLRYDIFKRLFKECSSHKDNGYWLMPKLTGIKEAAMVYESYVSRQISDDFIRGFRNLLGGENNEAHDWLHDKINKHSNNQFLYSPKELPWDQKMKLKHTEDIDYLFDQQSLINLAQRIFNTYDKSSLKKKEIARRITRGTLNTDLRENLALDILRDLVEEDERGVSMNDFLDFVNDENRWRWFQVSELLSKEIQHQVDLEAREIRFLRQWTEEKFPECDFKTALTMSGSTYHYRYLEKYIVYLVRSHDFEISNSLKLDFLYMSSNFVLLKKRSSDDSGNDSDLPKELFQWIVSKCGLEATKQKTVEVLKESLPEDVTVNLASFCANNNVFECLPSILSHIQDRSYNDYNRNRLLDAYFELDGNSNSIVKIIDQFSFSTMLHTFELLNKCGYSELEKLCLQFLEEEEDIDRQQELINRMVKCSLRSGYQELANWIEVNKQLPDRNRVYTSLEPSDNILKDVYPYFIQIYECAVENDFGDWDFEGRRSYLEIILKAGTQSESSYNEVRFKFNQWMDKYDNHTFLYLKLEELDKLYFQKANPTMSLEQVLELLNE